MAGKLPTKDDKSFSLFFVVERTDVKSDANLQLEYAIASFDISVRLDCGVKRKFPEMSGEGHDVKMPVLVNPKDIPAHTKLLAMDDVAVHKIQAKADKK